MISLQTPRLVAGPVYLPRHLKLHDAAAAICASVAEIMQGGKMARPASLMGLGIVTKKYFQPGQRVKERQLLQRQALINAYLTLGGGS